MLYLTIGSACNACVEKNPEHATVLRLAPDGSRREVFAKGLRNVLGLDWDPRTGALYGMDNGSDERGDDVPPEELNRIEAGKDYGWPHCFAERVPDPVLKRAGGCDATEKSLLGYTAHAAPIGFVFYEGGQFPPEYRGDAFVTFRGSWNRSRPSGYAIARVRFEAGEPKAIEEFVTGFLAPDGKSQFARLAGLAVAKDGALLAADDENGVIYRIGFDGPAVGSGTPPGRGG
jgi:glucose/arabinose dehydrogenase